ncbi:MAG TPA: hypothetical protein VK190_08765 [Pseudoneobacillus sp.]|nr:hypothetical protein [Pseudoneobacillus sp.]
MDYNDGKVEISYQVLSESMGILTVAFFMDQQLLHIIAGEKEIMIAKLNTIFK